MNALSSSAPLSPQELEALRHFSTPTLANAIEVFGVRPRNQGFMGSEIKAIFPEMGAMIGYACTGRIVANQPPDRGLPPVPEDAYWDAVLTVPSPRVAVIQELDSQPVGSLWGEVNANIHRALGCVGAVTNGGVRDLAEVKALGFHFFATAVLVSHAYVRYVDYGRPVQVGGLTVQPGDLICADQHGVLLVPLEIASALPQVAREIEARERELIVWCQSDAFTPQGLRAVRDDVRRRWPKPPKLDTT
jgi:4-hydroxy-4-methyl-2-oxoglutarate aldolase